MLGSESGRPACLVSGSSTSNARIAAVADERLLGIVGGVGPESTADYYRSIVREYQRRRPDGSYPRLLINSLDAGAVFRPMMAGDGDGVGAFLVAAVHQLAAAGAGVAAIASVTTHMGYDYLEPRSPIPLLSILDAIRDAAIQRGIRRPAVFATRVTTEGAFFAEPLERAGIALVRPDETDRAWIHEMYMSELVRGVFRDESRARLVEIATGLRDRQGIDGLILGGTELPLLVREPTLAGVPVLDPTRIHVDRLVAWLLADATG
jgi:aspartate racemase